MAQESSPTAASQNRTIGYYTTEVILIYSTAHGSNGYLLSYTPKRIDKGTAMISRQICAEMPIENLGVSEECLDALKRSGVDIVDDLVMYFEQTCGGRANPGRLDSRFIKCLPEIVKQLKVVGCWLEDLEDVD